MAKIRVGEIRDALKSIDGKVYSNREDMDNALFPLFGPLQSAFPGMSFRDLADILIGKGWVTLDPNRGFKVVLPAIKDEKNAVEVAPIAPPNLFELRSSLTFREIGVLVEVHSEGPVVGDRIPKYDSLVAKGLIEYVDLAGSPDLDNATITERVNELKANIMVAASKGLFKDVKKLSEKCEALIESVHEPEFGYRLTNIGRVLMDEQPDSKSDN